VAGSFYKTHAQAVSETHAKFLVEVPLADGSGTVRVDKFYEGLELRGRTAEDVVYRLTLDGAELIEA
jgi:hypothetical protein